MMIGGGSRGKDRGQWDGWGLEECSKSPADGVGVEVRGAGGGVRWGVYRF